MPATQQLTITLPNEIAEAVKSRVASGEYATESELFAEAVLDFILFPEVNDADLEHWIATDGVRRYDAMKADPSRGLTSEQVFANLGLESEEGLKAE